MFSLSHARSAALFCAVLSLMSLTGCDDALVDVGPQAEATASQPEGSFACTITGSIGGPNKVYSYGQFRYTLNWTITSAGRAPDCQITAKSIGLAPGTPADVVVCGSGTTNGRPWIDVCTDYAPDGFSFQVNGTIRYFNGVDSGHQYSYPTKTVVFDNSLG